MTTRNNEGLDLVLSHRSHNTRRGRLRAAVAAALAPAVAPVALLAVLAPAPAFADDTHSHAPTPAGSSAAAEDAISEDVETALTPEQQARLDQVATAAAAAGQAAGDVSVALGDANLASAAAAEAADDASTAAEEAAGAGLQADLAQVEVARSRARVEAWVRHLALDEGQQARWVAALTLPGSGDPGTVLAEGAADGNAAASLAAAVADLRVATDAAVELAEEATAAATEAAQAQAKAEKAARVAARTLVAARADYAARQGELDGLVGGLIDAPWVGDRMPETGAPILAGTEPAAGGCADPIPGMAYSNGMLPDDVLCPVLSAPGHRMRTDAAHAFDAMSSAFAGSLGKPLCITDSYRTFDAQVDLKKRKPYLAAVPGTSNHGWGVAIDACDGIEDFTSREHAWMMANAPLFGWVLPAWAQADGSKPEPWHWEFSDTLAEQMAAIWNSPATTAKDKTARDKNAAQPTRQTTRQTNKQQGKQAGKDAGQGQGQGHGRDQAPGQTGGAPSQSGAGNSDHFAPPAAPGRGQRPAHAGRPDS